MRFNLHIPYKIISVPMNKITQLTAILAIILFTAACAAQNPAAGDAGALEPAPTASKIEPTPAIPTTGPTAPDEAPGPGPTTPANQVSLGDWVEEAPQTFAYTNATFEIDGRPVTLVNGAAEEEAAPGSATKILTKVLGSAATGDLNGDGQDDAAFFLTQESGGSGTFFYVVAALQTGTGYQGTNAVFLGDRILAQATEIGNGKVIVNYADRKPGEPFSAQPSVDVTKSFEVKDGILLETQK